MLKKMILYLFVIKYINKTCFDITNRSYTLLTTGVKIFLFSKLSQVKYH